MWSLSCALSAVTAGLNTMMTLNIIVRITTGSKYSLIQKNEWFTPSQLFFHVKCDRRWNCRMFLSRNILIQLARVVLLFLFSTWTETFHTINVALHLTDIESWDIFFWKRGEEKKMALDYWRYLWAVKTHHSVLYAVDVGLSAWSHWSLNRKEMWCRSWPADLHASCQWANWKRERNSRGTEWGINSLSNSHCSTFHHVSLHLHSGSVLSFSLLRPASGFCWISWTDWTESRALSCSPEDSHVESLQTC